MFGLSKLQGRKLHSELGEMHDWPHTVLNVCALRQKYDGYLELPEPLPIEWYDFPDKVKIFVEQLYPSSKKTHYEVPIDDVDT